MVVVTGMSGAGRSAALRSLEDYGFYCIDNCPTSLIDALIEHLQSTAGRRNVALGIDRRSAQSAQEISDAVTRIAESGCRVEVLFLDCSDQVLVRRFSETRRPHVLGADGDLLDAIRKEREELAPLRGRADHVIDTSDMSVHELRRTLASFGETDAKRPLRVKLISFGFKHGAPADANVLFDMRFLPNAHFVPELKPLTGLDQRVSAYTLGDARAQEFWQSFVQCMEQAMRAYVDEGKSYVTIAIGCTGGRHRSVALIEALRALWQDRYRLTVVHRDIERD